MARQGRDKAVRKQTECRGANRYGGAQRLAPVSSDPGSLSPQMATLPARRRIRIVPDRLERGEISAALLKPFSSVYHYALVFPRVLPPRHTNSASLKMKKSNGLERSLLWQPPSSARLMRGKKDTIVCAQVTDESARIDPHKAAQPRMPTSAPRRPPRFRPSPSRPMTKVYNGNASLGQVPSAASSE